LSNLRERVGVLGWSRRVPNAAVREMGSRRGYHHAIQAICLAEATYCVTSSVWLSFQCSFSNPAMKNEGQYLK